MNYEVKLSLKFKLPSVRRIPTGLELREWIQERRVKSVGIKCAAVLQREKRELWKKGLAKKKEEKEERERLTIKG